MSDKRKTDSATEPKKRSPKLRWGPPPGRRRRAKSRRADHPSDEQRALGGPPDDAGLRELAKRREMEPEPTTPPRVQHNKIRLLLLVRAKREERQVRAIRDAALHIMRKRGRYRICFGRTVPLVGSLEFVISHYTIFNPILVKTDSEEWEFWRRFQYRLMIGNAKRSVADIYWNRDDRLRARSFDGEPRWQSEFLRDAASLSNWHWLLDPRL
jgi:hypothetical protein